MLWNKALLISNMLRGCSYNSKVLLTPHHIRPYLLMPHEVSHVGNACSCNATLVLRGSAITSITSLLRFHGCPFTIENHQAYH
jgi:hypothetical protein